MSSSDNDDWRLDEDLCAAEWAHQQALEARQRWEDIEATLSADPYYHLWLDYVASNGGNNGNHC